jgi:hypothetical protein
LRQQLQSLAPTGYGADLIAGAREDKRQGSADRRVVVDNKNAGTVRHLMNLKGTNQAITTMFPWASFKF